MVQELSILRECCRLPTIFQFLLYKSDVVSFRHTGDCAIHIGNCRRHVGFCSHLAAAGCDAPAPALEYQKHRGNTRLKLPLLACVPFIGGIAGYDGGGIPHTRIVPARLIRIFHVISTTGAQ